MKGPYGGTWDGSTGTFPVSVDTRVVLGSDGTVGDFLSLPTDSFVIVGFKDEAIVNKAGDDIFIEECAGNGEKADIYVSSNGKQFTKIGTAEGGELARFDLSDIGWNGLVTAIKIVGLNNAGGSPGYDVLNVSALNFQALKKDNDLEGTNRKDTILGRAGNDKLSGKGGNDIVNGGTGNDVVRGGAGNDKLICGKGKDKAFGNGGSDTFVFHKNEGMRNTVVDFKNNKDKLDLKSFKFKNTKDALKHFSDAGGKNDNKVVFEDSGTKVVIKGIDLNELNGPDLLI